MLSRVILKSSARTLLFEEPTTHQNDFFYFIKYKWTSRRYIKIAKNRKT